MYDIWEMTKGLGLGDDGMNDKDKYDIVNTYRERMMCDWVGV